MHLNLNYAYENTILNNLDRIFSDGETSSEKEKVEQSSKFFSLIF